jgi:hypothetical protein
MYKKIILVFGVWLFLCSCNSEEKPSTNINEVKHDSLNKSDDKTCKEIALAEKKSEVIKDAFIGNTLKFSLSRKQIDLSFKDVKKSNKLVSNKYSAGVFDTVVTYKVDCDSIAYMASAENKFPLYASLQSNRIRFFSGEIGIGLSKSEFINKLKLKSDIEDCIKVTETEGANEIVFVFKDQKLARIVYKNLYVE